MGKRAPIDWKILLQAALIVAAGFWIYWPALRGGWLWDDEVYVTKNPLLHDLTGLWKIWFVPGSFREYYPLDSSVYWVEWHLWGTTTTGYHVVNVGLHLLSSLLVWRLLAKFGQKLGWLGGLLFAIHPVQVESVAWISELKNTLSLPFFLCAMICWIDYEENNRPGEYILALILFLVAMLGKPTMVAFPAAILLYAWWKRGRIEWRDLKVSLPFFVVSLILGIVAAWLVQKAQPLADAGNAGAAGGVIAQIIVAGLVLPFFLLKAFLPLGLMPIYPSWTVIPLHPAQLLPWPILAGVFWYLSTKRKSWGRHALLGLGFILVMLAPTIGFMAMNYTTMIWSMDHLEYLAMIGWAGLIVAGLGQFEERLPSSLYLLGVGLLVLMMSWLGWESRGYASHYSDQITFMNYALKNNPQAWSAHNDLGVALYQAGQVPEAIEQFNQAIKIKPSYAEAHYDLGYLMLNENRPQEAIEQFARASSLKTDFAEVHYNWGNALMGLDRFSEATEQYQQAVKINPDYGEAHYNLGAAMMQTGRVPEAIEQFQQAARIEPDNVDAYVNLGVALMRIGRVPEAPEHFEEALRIQPNDVEAHDNLGIALYTLGRVPEAIEQFELALKINPQDANARDYLNKMETKQQSSSTNK